jgi:hypothetical protein
MRGVCPHKTSTPGGCKCGDVPQYWHCAERRIAELEALLRGVVPQTYGEAVPRFGRKLIDCQPHEWDNNTTEENAEYLAQRYEVAGKVDRPFAGGEKCSSE